MNEKNRLDNRFTADQWREYYDAMRGLGTRPTLLAALERVAVPDPAPGGNSAEPFAIDLGCGEGRDTAELLRRGFRVLALDGQTEGIDRLLARVADLPEAERARLETRVARFEGLTLSGDIPPIGAALVNAGYALPFCPPDAFPTLWGEMTNALNQGSGCFCGQLFGDRDGWAGDPKMTHHTRADAERLLAGSGYAVTLFEEEERDGVTATGNPKHWHIFNIIARRV